MAFEEVVPVSSILMNQTLMIARALSDPTRLSVLASITETSSVSQLARLLRVNRRTIRHHLLVLQAAGILVLLTQDGRTRASPR